MTILADDELAAATELIACLVTDGLEAESPPERVADLERLALATQAPFCWPDSPPELAQALVRALGGRGDELAAGLLAAMARLASEPLAGLAEAEARRLAAGGIVSAHADAVGRLVVVEAHRMEAGYGAAEIWLGVLGRPGETLVQPLIVFVEHAPCGAVIEGARLGEPMARDDAARLLEGREGTPCRVPAQDLVPWLTAALEHMVRHDVALDVEAARILPLFERALTGHAGRLPRPGAAELEPEEPERRDAEALVEAFARQLEDADVAAGVLEHGPFVAHTMLDWKLDYADGELVRWGLGDLREYLLDWFPRKVTCEEETIAVAPAAVSEFLRFLDAAELLDAPVPLASLTAAVKRLAPGFREACGDPRNWGPAKTMTARMAEDGVDLHDPAAIQAWVEDFNVRAFGERDEPLGPARAATAGAKRDRRKAARSARKRNRR